MRLALVALIACGSSQPGGETVDFVGGFTASFPSPPTWRHPARGTTVETHAVQDRHAIEYAVWYDELPHDMSRREGVRVVEVTRDEVLRSTRSAVASESAIALGDVPGTELVFERKNGDAAITRIYATPSHVYEVSAAGPDKAVVTTFLDSFRLLAK